MHFPSLTLSEWTGSGQHSLDIKIVVRCRIASDTPNPSDPLQRGGSL